MSFFGSKDASKDSAISDAPEQKIEPAPKAEETPVAKESIAKKKETPQKPKLPKEILDIMEAAGKNTRKALFKDKEDG